MLLMYIFNFSTNITPSTLSMDTRQEPPSLSKSQDDQQFVF